MGHEPSKLILSGSEQIEIPGAVTFSTPQYDSSNNQSRRIHALDGLRGIAALVVVVFHFFCMLLPTMVPDLTATPTWLADTPVGILWNGPFAVSIFFVLSGFVIAGAAENRHRNLVSNTITRHLRLGLPAAASALFAWTLLTLFPTASIELREVMVNPSRWLDYTHQENIPPPHNALLDGLFGIFVRGESAFNNVLWTMKIELLGSLGIFGVYWLTAGRPRIVFLLLIGVAVLAMERFVYLAFVLGALMYEAHFRRKINSLGNIVPYVALGIGIVLGAAWPGTAERWGFPDLPDPITVGNKVGIIPIVAASLIMLAIIALPKVGRCLSSSVTKWLGRVSFALYLVHVPLLYTLVAFGFVHLNWSIGLLALTYLLLVLMLSHLFTISVDEPVLRQLPNVSRALRPLEHATGVLRFRRIS